jgi:aminopeptidase N
MKTINVEGLYEARKELRFQMAQHLETRFAQTYQSNYDLGPYHYDTLSAERRQLVNTCLSYLMLLKKPSYEAYCVLQFNNANNMTDRIHTLSELVQHNLPQCGPALSEFYQTWSQNSVVLCLWFAIQARVTSHETLSRVKQLLHHSAFDWKNPNKIRALIGTFCTNWMAFHDASGTGYRFLTQQILYLDQFNPQIAARLVTPFAQWKRFDLKRQTLMKEQLESILKNENLSIDVFERVKKAI